MGLGKTLQIVSLVHTVLTHPEIEIKTVIVVTPLSTVENWKNEFAMWTRNINDGEDLVVYDISRLDFVLKVGELIANPMSLFWQPKEGKRQKVHFEDLAKERRHHGY
jgi:SNF2 family DNA or RNA helicase